MAQTGTIEPVGVMLSAQELSMQGLAAAAVSGSSMSPTSQVSTHWGYEIAPNCGQATRASPHTRSSAPTRLTACFAWATSAIIEDDGGEWEIIWDPPEYKGIELDWELFDSVTCSFNFTEWSLEGSPLPHYRPFPLHAKKPCATTRKLPCPPSPEPVATTRKDVGAHAEFPITSAFGDSSMAFKTTTSEASPISFQMRNLKPPSKSTTGTHDDESDREPRLEEPRSVKVRRSSTQSGLTASIYNEGSTLSGSPIHVEDTCAMGTGSGTEQKIGIDRSEIGEKTTPTTLGKSALEEQDPSQGPMLVSPDRPVNHKVYDDASNQDTVSDYDILRSPSPWQTANHVRSERPLARAFAWITNRLDSAPSLQENPGRCPQSSGASSPSIPGVGCFTHYPIGCEGGSSSGAASQPPVLGSSSSATTSSHKGSKRRRELLPQEENGDDEDGNEPTRRRLGPTTQGQQPTRQRFACPYQKYNPSRSPRCYRPGPRNDMGGAETFSRVKSHVLRNHNPFIWCHTCWKAFRSDSEAERHESAQNCIKKKPPNNNYWMNREQRDQIRQRRFLGDNKENWFHLFSILLPEVPADGPNGYRTYSPYYTATDFAYALPTPTSEPTPSSGQTPLFPEQANESLSFSQRPRDNTVPDAYLPPLFEDLGTDTGMGDIIQWDNLDGGFNSLVYDESSQTQTQINTPTAPPASEAPKTAQGPGQLSAKGPDPVSSPRITFLRKDNARLRESNSQLQNEVEMLRSQNGDMRSHLQPLDRSLQELLYLPSVQDGEGEVADRLFTILDRVMAMRKTLDSGAGGG